MKQWIYGVLMFAACGGSKPPPPPEPTLPPPERTIDCTKLTDHVIDAMLVGSADTKDDLAARRAKLLAECPKTWHADHPSADELKTTDCMMAARSSADINVCVGLPKDEPILHTPKSGIPECDDYAAKVELLLHCEAVPQATRDHLRESFAAATVHWAEIPETAKENLGKECVVGASAIHQIASSMKCPH